MDYSNIPTMVNPLFTVSDFLSTESREDLISEIYTGLTARQKYISSRFFYDDKGSSLFEEITALPEYYPTRTEISILKANAQKILGDFEKLDIIELGSGDCSKISILLEAIPKNKIANVSYIPVDVSGAAIYKSADILSLKYPELKIQGLLADFLKHLTQLPGKGNRLICFFGSTIGNLNRNEALGFLKNVKKHLCPGDKFLLGLDRVKDFKVLHNAYNDKQGITALFNKNILDVINQTVGTSFNTRHFEHLAYYNEKMARIEMHLKADKDIVISSDLFPEKVYLKKGKTIHTENSHKFTLNDIHVFANISGLKIENIFNDKREWFSLINFKA
jgi:L-histidine N-alpha-methyltransferase